MDLKELKSLLPDGSYQEIADAIGKSYGTVRDVFSEKIVDRTGADTKELILEQARKIVKERSWKGLEIVYGLDKTRAIKAALAA